MKIAVNDLSFQYPFFDYQEAQNNLIYFVNLCKELESGALTNVEQIVSGEVNKSYEIAPGCKLYTLISKLNPDIKRYLLGILVSRGKIDENPEKRFEMYGKTSDICAWAVNHMIISLQSSVLFCSEKVSGIIDEKRVEIKNISSKEHFYIYRHNLGMRIYRGNDEKHKRERDNPYGKGRVGSQMDLTQEQAQKLLNRAVLIKGRLYARYQSRNYTFQNEQDVIYHGYITDDLGDDIKGELNKYIWN